MKKNFFAFLAWLWNGPTFPSDPAKVDMSEDGTQVSILTQGGHHHPLLWRCLMGCFIIMLFMGIVIILLWSKPPLPASSPSTEPLQGAIGDLRFNLAWEGPSDMDLYLNPGKVSQVYYGKKTYSDANTTATLDIDANLSRIVPNPQENIYITNPTWNSDTPYSIALKCANARGDSVINCMVTIQIPLIIRPDSIVAFNLRKNL